MTGFIASMLRLRAVVPAFAVGPSSRSLGPIELSVLARRTVRPRLVGIPGVANVAIRGHRDRQLPGSREV